MSRVDPRTGRFPIDEALVRRLVSKQFPAWADLPVRSVSEQGNDNRTFRLGKEMSVRLPSAPRYAASVAKEQAWLKRLAPHLPLPIPAPIAVGQPDETYPCHWSVYGWLAGETAATARLSDLTSFATALGSFLMALQSVDACEGPPAGAHSFFRGCALRDLKIWDEQVRGAIKSLGERIDTGGATEVWEGALRVDWQREPVWFHGDIASTNLLVLDSELSAVIDFGCCGVGDPACDLTIAWTLLAGESRGRFKSILKLDRATWARGRGWTLWKALIIEAQQKRGEKPTIWTHNPTSGRRIVDEVIADHWKTS